MPQIMTILGELREGAVFREQMPKNDWPKEQNKKRNKRKPKDFQRTRNNV